MAKARRPSPWLTPSPLLFVMSSELIRGVNEQSEQKGRIDSRPKSRKEWETSSSSSPALRGSQIQGRGDVVGSLSSRRVLDDHGYKTVGTLLFFHKEASLLWTRFEPGTIPPETLGKEKLECTSNQLIWTLLASFTQIIDWRSVSHNLGKCIVILFVDLKSKPSDHGQFRDGETQTRASHRTVHDPKDFLAPGISSCSVFTSMEPLPFLITL
ncbi:hypothetical protein LXL04_009011 [Taraxacum kok-saghyz]